MTKTRLLTALGVLTLTPSALAGTAPFFTPLTQSAPVTAPNSSEEVNSPWVTPSNVTQINRTSMKEIESDITQSIVRVPGLGSQASMVDMLSFDPTGNYVFFPHETQWGAGLTRYNRSTDKAEILFQGDTQGSVGNWTNDYGAFDPSLWTPNGTVFVAEEWAGRGRVIEVTNPLAAPAAINKRELTCIPNVAHEGLRFSADGKTLYFIDEFNSGSIYKFVMPVAGDYLNGTSYVLKVTGYTGDVTRNWDDASGVGSPRTGAATWEPISAGCAPLSGFTDPFRDGDTNLPTTNPGSLGGRVIADEKGGTPYGRPEDIEMATLANGREVIYFAATSEQAVYAIEVLSATTATVRLSANASTAKNVGYPGTTGTLSSPDNLAQDRFGNIYIVEDSPNSGSTGGDIWFLRDTNNDSVAESLDHFMSLRVAGSEGTGMIFNPANPREFVVMVQHPTSTDLAAVPGGVGDALWAFQVPAPTPVGPVVPWLVGAGLAGATALARRRWVMRRRAVTA